MVLMYVSFSDLKANDFHSEADSNDGRSSGKNHLFCPPYNLVYFFLFKFHQSIVLNRQIIYLNP